MIDIVYIRVLVNNFQLGYSERAKRAGAVTIRLINLPNVQGPYYRSPASLLRRFRHTRRSALATQIVAYSRDHRTAAQLRLQATPLRQNSPMPGDSYGCEMLELY